MKDNTHPAGYDSFDGWEGGVNVPREGQPYWDVLVDGEVHVVTNGGFFNACKRTGKAYKVMAFHRNLPPSR